MSHTVLVVDDDAPVLDVLACMLVPAWMVMNSPSEPRAFVRRSRFFSYLVASEGVMAFRFSGSRSLKKTWPA